MYHYIKMGEFTNPRYMLNGPDWERTTALTAFLTMHISAVSSDSDLFCFLVMFPEPFLFKTPSLRERQRASDCALVELLTETHVYTATFRWAADYVINRRY